MAEPQPSNAPCVDEQADYFPPELVGYFVKDSTTVYHLYLIELGRNFKYNVPLHDIVLAVRTELELDENMTFDLEVDRGNLTVHMKYVGVVSLTSEEVSLCLRFQITLLSILLNQNLKKLKGILDAFHLRNDIAVFDYLLLPSTGLYLHQKQGIIDWKCVSSVLFPHENLCNNHTNRCLSEGNGRRLHTKNGSVCSCMLKNSLVCTPHNYLVYCITGILDDLDGNSLLRQKNGEEIPYKEYFKRRGIDLHFGRESLLNGRHMFSVQSYLKGCRQQEKKESSNASVELPPELCFIVMSPISISTIYSFSFVPSVMHRIDSLILAVNLKKMLADDCVQEVVIPTIKVLEAITTKKCQENFDLELLETLGDSFLKYATSQQLFKNNQNDNEGSLTEKRKKMISNESLCEHGCNRRLPGFIRNEAFDPKMWIIPGDQSRNYLLDEELVSSTRKVYIRGRRKVEIKKVADVVEALIGAYVVAGCESAAFSFMCWVGIEVDFVNIPYERHFPHLEKAVNRKYLESLLKYSFRDRSLLEEALLHGSCKQTEPAKSYQRLEFLGDAVLDYLIIMHLYNENPRMTPGLLTNLKSASTNNECYALSAVKAGLHKHILHDSQVLEKSIPIAVSHVGQLSSVSSTFGWEWETTYPKVLGDIIESLAGAIFIDSGYNKEIVFEKIRPLLMPMITPATLKLHPVSELKELCDKKKYIREDPVVFAENQMFSVTVEVIADGVLHIGSCTEGNTEMATKLASKAVLQSLKESMSGT